MRRSAAKKRELYYMRGRNPGKTDVVWGLTGGAADVDPQSQAAVAVVVGGRGCGKQSKHRQHVNLVPSAGSDTLNNHLCKTAALSTEQQPVPD